MWLIIDKSIYLYIHFLNIRVGKEFQATRHSLLDRQNTIYSREPKCRMCIKRIPKLWHQMVLFWRYFRPYDRPKGWRQSLRTQLLFVFLHYRLFYKLKKKRKKKSFNTTKGLTAEFIKKDIRKCIADLKVSRRNQNWINLHKHLKQREAAKNK